MSLKPLKFIHITKNAGTTIENIAKEKNINWGIFDSEYIDIVNNDKIHSEPWHNNIVKKPKNYDWFMVVRNPYDRIISEFHCKYSDTIAVRFRCKNSQEFNKYIQNRINVKCAVDNIKVYQNHYAPQYIYYDNDITLHILKFENIEIEFNDLMKKYSIDLTLNKHYNKTERIYDVKDLNKETIKLINHVYDKDFKLFGYYKINPDKI